MLFVLPGNPCLCCGTVQGRAEHQGTDYKRSDYQLRYGVPVISTVQLLWQSARHKESVKVYFWGPKQFHQN